MYGLEGRRGVLLDLHRFIYSFHFVKIGTLFFALATNKTNGVVFLRILGSVLPHFFFRPH